MKIIGRSDDMPVDQMGLSEDIVNKLHEKGIVGWDDLTLQSLKQLAEMGLKPEQVTEVSDAVQRLAQNLK